MNEHQRTLGYTHAKQPGNAITRFPAALVINSRTDLQRWRQTLDEFYRRIARYTEPSTNLVYIRHEGRSLSDQLSFNASEGTSSPPYPQAARS
jgi:hypothetical protein